MLDFISDLYENLLEHRSALITLVAAQHELDEDVYAHVVRAFANCKTKLYEISGSFSDAGSRRRQSAVSQPKETDGLYSGRAPSAHRFASRFP